MLRILRIVRSFFSKLDGKDKDLLKKSKDVDEMIAEIVSFMNFVADLDGGVESKCQKDGSDIVYLPLFYVEKIRESIIMMYEKSDDPIIRGFMSRSNLEFIVDHVKEVGYDLPSREEKLVKKAAFILYNIITKHPFTDGNKRTGLLVADMFLQYNGMTIANLPFKESRDFITSVAKNEKTLEQCMDFIAKRMEKMEVSSEIKKRLKNFVEVLELKDVNMMKMKHHED
jgi:death-on-curing protein